MDLLSVLVCGREVVRACATNFRRRLQSFLDTRVKMGEGYELR